MAAGGGSTGSYTYTLDLDGTTVSTQTLASPSASWSWDTTTASNGSHVLTLTVTSDGQAATATRAVTVNNVPPVTAAFTDPAEGAALTGVVTIGMAAGGGSSGSYAYALAIDGATVFSQTSSSTSASWTWDTASATNGAHTLRLIVAADGESATVTRTVTVSDPRATRVYLQLATPWSIVVRWRTDVATDGVVRYGTDAAALTEQVTIPTVTTEHEVTLAGLMPDTRYYYAVGSSSATLAGDASYTFVTAPAIPVSRPTRIWVIGDSGTADASAAAVRDAYLAYTGTRGTDVWLMLGDNAYEGGTDAEYQAAVFETYPTLLRQTVLWPSLGNHDARSSDSAAQTGPYYDSFTLPTNGEAGGVPSGTEAYYSFDHGDIHVVVLDSSDGDRSPNGPMATWLRQDLAANTKRWVIAVWHHAPYTKSSHDSDTEADLVEMREHIVPILEAYNVDLVLTGHGHSYERSFLLDGHDSASYTLTPDMKKDAGDGREDGTGAYKKLGLRPHEGTVYVVAGNGGRLEGTPRAHPAMFASRHVLGSLVIDVDGGRLDATMIGADGAVHDYFTILKTTPTPPPVPPDTPLTLEFTEPAEGATVKGTVPVTLSASGGSGYRYSLKVDGTVVWAGTDPTTSWNTTTTTDGGHVLTGTVTDEFGRTATATRSVIVGNGGASFTASIQYPADGATVRGLQSIGMATTAPWGKTKTFRLSVDDTVIWTATTTGTTAWIRWDSTTTPDGPHALRFEVTDKEETATATRTINVDN